jgi:hypothetical protein
VIVGRRPYSLDKTAGVALYDPDSLDYFLVIDGDGAIYLLPSRVVAGRARIYIRGYSEYRRRRLEPVGRPGAPRSTGS